MTFAEEIAQAAKLAATEAGFDLAGIAPVRPEDLPSSAPLFEWVDAGRAGEIEISGVTHGNGDLRRASAMNAAPWVAPLWCAPELQR